jgi:hypothetical protein
MSGDECNNLSRYNALRDYITHEDSLINNRLTWLLASQGLLFSAFSALFKPMADLALSGEKCHMSNHAIEMFSDLKMLQYILSVLGLSISVICYIGIDAATKTIGQIVDDFEAEIVQDEKLKLPALTAGGSQEARKFGAFSSRAIPISLLLAWLVVILNLILHDNYQLFVVLIIGFVIGVTSTVWVYWGKLDLSLDCMKIRSSETND